MIRRYLRLAIAALVLTFAILQFLDTHWGNGIFLTLLAGIPVLLHFRNERNPARALVCAFPELCQSGSAT